ncbi:DUF1127 domain-containing protein [Tropicimonas sp. IMCC34043]|uniref:DUF1127 domain-containing protein n=1 Tax=Tropicimonas sp. IMCC34043 TaxID=2248760 RepID=UPI000E289C3C|nr:DUF1127 domain-containing protein [Tropicimonas sp. IMCC34043]
MSDYLASPVSNTGLGRITAVFSAAGRFLVAMVAALQRYRLYQELGHLSDRELARLGLTREALLRHPVLDD